MKKCPVQLSLFSQLRNGYKVYHIENTHGVEDILTGKYEPHSLVGMDSDQPKPKTEEDNTVSALIAITAEDEEYENKVM